MKIHLMIKDKREICKCCWELIEWIFVCLAIFSTTSPQQNNKKWRLGEAFSCLAPYWNSVFSKHI